MALPIISEYREILKGAGAQRITLVDLYKPDGTFIKTLTASSVRVGKRRPATFSFEMEKMDADVVRGSVVNILMGYEAQGNSKYDLNFKGDSTEDYVIRHPIDNFPASQITAEAWIKSRDNNDGIISYASSATVSNDFLIYNSASISIHIANQIAVTGVSVQDDARHHIAVTWQSSNGEVKLYVDGALRFTGTLAQGLTITNNGSLMVGQEQDAPGGLLDPNQAFKGSISDVRIWNVVRSQSNIQLNMNTALSGTETGLILNWRLDKDTGVIARDSGLHANHGTIIGARFMPKHLFSQGHFVVTNIDPDVSDSPVVSVSGIDFTEKFNGSKFHQTTKWEDTVTDTGITVTAAAASSAIAAGSQIQHQGEIKSLKGYATLSGILSEVANEHSGQHPQNIINNNTTDDYRFKFTFQAMSKLKVEVKIDLKTIESLSSLTPQVVSGSVTLLRTSTNGTVWTTQPVAGFSTTQSVRYIEMTVEKAPVNNVAEIIIQEIQCVTASSHPATSAHDSDPNKSTAWRPSKSDLDRYIELTFASSVINVLYLYWGINYLDFWNRVKYKVYYLSGTSWVLLADQSAQSVVGFVEHVFNPVTTTKLRIEIVETTGVIALRHVDIRNITAVNTYSYLFRVIAEGAGITQHRITPTRMYKASLLKRYGEDRQTVLDELAEAIQWEWFFDSDNYLVFRPEVIDPTNPAWSLTVGEDNIESFSPRFSSQDVRNVVIVVSDRPEAVLTSIVKNDNLYDPASIQQIGEKTADPIENNFLKTQAEVDFVAQMELWRQSRFRHSASDSIMPNPAMEVGDVIKFKESFFTNVDTVYLVQSIDIDSGSNTMTVEVMEI